MLKSYTRRKHLFLEIMNYIHKFSILKNAGVTDYKCLFSLESSFQELWKL